jgi:hypothetical protein
LLSFQAALLQVIEQAFPPGLAFSLAAQKTQQLAASIRSYSISH